MPRAIKTILILGSYYFDGKPLCALSSSPPPVSHLRGTLLLVGRRVLINTLAVCAVTMLHTFTQKHGADTQPESVGAERDRERDMLQYGNLTAFRQLLTAKVAFLFF